MSGKIQFEDEFNYRPQNSTRAGYSRTRSKNKLSFTQRLVKSGVCKNTKSAEKFLLSIAIVSFTAGVIFTTSILNPAIKYKVIFTLQGKHLMTEKEAQAYVNHKVFYSDDDQ